MTTALRVSLIELIRRASAEIPDDVLAAILAALDREKRGTIAESALKIIEQNIALARKKSQPICQDTGSVIFYVDAAVSLDQLAFEEAACQAVREATQGGHPTGLPPAEFGRFSHGQERRYELGTRRSCPAFSSAFIL